MSLSVVGNYAKEPPSKPWKKLRTLGPYEWGDGATGVDMTNDEYDVCVRWDWIGRETDASHAMIQVCRADGGSVMDWRDLQAIKNDVCGPEWEAVELYPAESRLKDPSNARYLWCRKEPFPFGLPGGRLVLPSTKSIAPQRPLAEEIAQ